MTAALSDVRGLINIFFARLRGVFRALFSLVSSLCAGEFVRPSVAALFYRCFVIKYAIFPLDYLVNAFRGCGKGFDSLSELSF